MRESEPINYSEELVYKYSQVPKTRAGENLCKTGRSEKNISLHENEWLGWKFHYLYPINGQA